MSRLAMECIKFYTSTGEHGYLSNFSNYKVKIGDVTYKTLEHYYQSKKFDDQEIIKKIVTSDSPEEAAYIGRSNKHLYIDDWDNKKLGYMESALIAKFSQNPSLYENLMNTVGSELIEDSPNDTYWGCGKCGTGKNMLGKTIMKIRDTISSETIINPSSIYFEHNLANVSWGEISKLFTLAGWKKRNPEEVKGAFLNSSNVFYAIHKTRFEKRIVGFIRVISDKHQYACLYDLIVHPLYRNKGIAATLMNMAIEEYSDITLIHMFSEPNLINYYTQFGFKQISTGMMLYDGDEFEKHIRNN